MTLSKKTLTIRANIPPSSSVEERFWSKVDKQNECWIWQGSATNGYGAFALTHSTIVLAHKFSYEWLKGPVPDGYQVDHLCHNLDISCEGGVTCLHRRCLNPDHLEAVLPAVNRARGITARPNAGRHWSERTHCGHGHEYTAENTYIRLRNGKFWARSCRTCNRDRVRKFNAA